MVAVLALSHQAGNEAGEREHDEDHEENLCDPGRTGRNAAEPEKRCHQRDDQKYDCVVQHAELLTEGKPRVEGWGRVQSLNGLGPA